MSTNFRQGCKYLSMPNILAYFGAWFIKAKRFYSSEPQN
jgi:hypothetical protein